MENSSQDMSDKVCMVTGTTSGIGKETARGLAKMGATVIMVVRNPETGEEVRQEIMTETGNTSIELMIADLFSMAEVRSVASDFKNTHSRLDVLINNAGGIFPKREMTVDGFERTFALNYLAPFLLTHELLDILKMSAPSRIINVSSAAHTRGKIDFGNLQSEKKYGQLGPYGNVKLMNIMFSYALARRLEGTNVTVNVLHPGIVRTRFGLNDASRARKLMFKIVGPLSISPEKGAETSIYLASSPEVEGISGKYFAKCTSIESTKISYDEELQEKLWEHTKELLASV
jgi:NAD(P)-dependent dehydrogenase (short-subunit alcohol dehydrogenase family)